MRGPGLEGDWLIALRTKVAVPPALFSGSLARQSLLHAAPLSRLQVVGVALHFLDDVFRLHFTLEPAKRVFQRLSLLQSNFCQFDLLPASKPATYSLHDFHFRRSLRLSLSWYLSPFAQPILSQQSRATEPANQPRMRHNDEAHYVRGNIR